MSSAGGFKRIRGFRLLERLGEEPDGPCVACKAICETANIIPRLKPGTVVTLKVSYTERNDDRMFLRLSSQVLDLAYLRHPNVATYYGALMMPREADSLLILAREFLAGETLEAALRRERGGLDSDVALWIAESFLDGLVYLVSQGVIHRDIKSSNVFISSEGDVKLTGLDSIWRSCANGLAFGAVSDADRPYRAPEFGEFGFRGDEISTVFGAGVILHEMLLGRKPKLNREGTAYSIPHKLDRVQEGVASVLERALAFERTRRYQRLSDFLDDVRGLKLRVLSHHGKSWRIVRLIGKGGFGEVFKANDVQTGEEVAIKHLLRSEYAKRFRREAKMMRKLNDSCFARFIDFVELHHAGSTAAFLVMEYLEGMPGLSLRDALRRAEGRPLARSVVVCAFTRYAHALAVMHAKEIYHRDIKPTNLYFPADPTRAAIMDFGIARDESGTMTSGLVPGTLDYMPPEVVASESRGDASTDIYALGLCFYEALTGKTVYPRLPGGQEGYLAFFERSKRGERPKLDESAFEGDADLLDLVKGMIEPDPARRISSAAEIESRLVQLGGSAPVDVNPAPHDAAGDSEDEEPDDADTSPTAMPDELEMYALSHERKAQRHKRIGLMIALGGLVLFSAIAVIVYLLSNH